MSDEKTARANSDYSSLIEHSVDESHPLVQSADIKPNHPERKCLIFTFVAAFVAVLGSFSFGSCIGYSSSALQDLQYASQGLHLDSRQGKWFTSLLNPGAMFGALITGELLVDAIGRKGALMVLPIPFVAGWLLLASAKNVSMLLIGRLITGLGAGGVSLAVPIYIAETSTPRLRGGLGSANQLAVSLGILYSYLMGAFLKWNWLAVVGLIPPTLLILFMFFMPETPRWLIAHNRRHDALRSLRWLRGSQANIMDECCEIESKLDTSKKMEWREFFKPSLTKPLFIGIGLMVFQQFCGINAVLFNSASIFEDAGFNNPKKVSIIIAVVQVFGTGVACLVIDRFGRRILLLIASVTMFVSLITLGVYFDIYIPKSSSGESAVEMETNPLQSSISHSIPAEKISWLSIMSLIIFNLGFAIAWGPIPWLMMSEIFPTRARGRASAIATVANWLCAFIVTLTFDPMIESIQEQGTYWFYGGFMFLSFIFVFFAVPETKGKTLEQIEALFLSGRSAGYDSLDSNEEE